MRDGRTRRVQTDDDGEDFLRTHCASLTVLTGSAAGSEWTLEQPRMLIGRSEEAAVRIDDRSVSAEHAALELTAGGFAVRDLASTNGLRVNGAPVQAIDLKHGDRIEVGCCELQYVVEPREAGRTWQLDDA